MRSLLHCVAALLGAIEGGRWGTETAIRLLQVRRRACLRALAHSRPLLRNAMLLDCQHLCLPALMHLLFAVGRAQALFAFSVDENAKVRKVAQTGTCTYRAFFDSTTWVKP